MRWSWANRANSKRQGGVRYTGADLLISSSRMGMSLFRHGFDCTFGIRGFRRRRIRLLSALGQLQSVVIIYDTSDVCMRFAERRHAIVLLHPPWACVVGSKRLGGIAIVTEQQLPQKANATVDVFGRIKAVSYAEVFGGFWHELHYALCSLTRDGARVVGAFRVNDAGNKICVDLAAGTGVADDGVQSLGCRDLAIGKIGLWRSRLEACDLRSGDIDEAAGRLIVKV